jgi:hypothetical protein
MLKTKMGQAISDASKRLRSTRYGSTNGAMYHGATQRNDFRKASEQSDYVLRNIDHQQSGEKIKIAEINKQKSPLS